jgi:hypothetical protein
MYQRQTKVTLAAARRSKQPFILGPIAETCRLSTELHDYEKRISSSVEGKD